MFESVISQRIQDYESEQVPKYLGEDLPAAFDAAKEMRDEVLIAGAFQDLETRKKLVERWRSPFIERMFENAMARRYFPDLPGSLDAAKIAPSNPLPEVAAYIAGEVESRRASFAECRQRGKDKLREALQQHVVDTPKEKRGNLAPPRMVGFSSSGEVLFFATAQAANQWFKNEDPCEAAMLLRLEYVKSRNPLMVDEVQAGPAAGKGASSGAKEKISSKQAAAETVSAASA